MGEVHAAAWQSTDAELIGCISAHSDQAVALASRYQMRTFADYAELLNEVEIVDICTPTPLHKPMVLQAAKAGKHVICEKPVALMAEDARSMILACKEAGVRFFVGMVVRFFPQYRLARELVLSGQIGNLGVLRLKRRFRSGAIALVEGGWAYPPGLFRTGIDLSGTGGLIEWNSDQPAPVLTFFPPKPHDTASVGLPVSGLGEDPYTAEIRHAYQAIQAGTNFEVTVEDALEALRISQAVEESLSTGKPVLL